jgi:hypothetical protein
VAVPCATAVVPGLGAMPPFTEVFPAEVPAPRVAVVRGGRVAVVQLDAGGRCRAQGLGFGVHCSGLRVKGKRFAI